MPAGSTENRQFEAAEPVGIRNHINPGDLPALDRDFWIRGLDTGD